jgi:hypothetical protein
LLLPEFVDYDNELSTQGELLVDYNKMDSETGILL